MLGALQNLTNTEGKEKLPLFPGRSGLICSSSWGKEQDEEGYVCAGNVLRSLGFVQPSLFQTADS